jgi:excisionase family DNA binding protein
VPSTRRRSRGGPNVSDPRVTVWRRSLRLPGNDETFSARTSQALQIGMESAQLALLKTGGANALSQTVTREGNQPNDILGVKEAAKYLHCSPSHVSNILNGKIPNLPPIPHVRAGRLRLIRRESLVRWLDEQETASRAIRER